MTSITQQKADLKDILRRVVMARYDSNDAKDQRSLAESLLGQLMASMTLSQLRAWHRGIGITDYMRTQIKQAAP